MQTEYHVVPDVRHKRAYEIYSIDDVSTTNLDGGTVTEFQPFFACRHGRSTNVNPTYWHSKRTFSESKKDKGTEVWLTLVDLNFDPSKPASEVISVSTTCSNRDLPWELRNSGGESWGFQLEGQAPVKRIDPLVPPTLPCRIPEGEIRWRLISHLALNHFSITDGESGADALREILKLYDYNSVPATAQQIAGIEQVTSRRKTARISGGQSMGFCRGIEVEITFNPEQYVGVGAFLLASVLDKFIGLYASINSFTRLTTKMRNASEPFKVWPYRVGEQTIL
jgi:type VI secretion system protein ImpG